MSRLADRLDDVSLQARRRLHALTQHLDKRPRRERIVLLAATAAIAFYLADLVWLTPAFKRLKTASAQLSAVRGELDALRGQVATLSAERRGEDLRLRGETQRLKEQLASEEAMLQTFERALVPSDQVVALLGQMLPRGGAVRVRELKSLPRMELGLDLREAPLVAPPGAPAGVAKAAMTPTQPASAPVKAAPAPSASEAGPRPALYRHGVEVTLEGSYGELAAYLHALEQMPRRVLWGGLSMSVEQHPKIVLTLKLYTLSLERDWMRL